MTSIEPAGNERTDSASSSLEGRSPIRYDNNSMRIPTVDYCPFSYTYRDRDKLSVAWAHPAVPFMSAETAYILIPLQTDSSGTMTHRFNSSSF